MFGVSIAAMNTFFYLGIDRLALGKGLAIEFIGPVAVAATRRRSTRNTIAVALVVVGVSLLSGIELGYLPVRKEARLGVQIGAWQ